jgi:hypothetical protein
MGPAPPSGIFAQGADLQGDGVLVECGNAGVEANAKRFRMFSSLAKNPRRLCLLRSLFGGHFRVSLPHGRRLSFSATQDSSYYAASGVASRASVSR